jgi:hypothetical protein
MKISAVNQRHFDWRALEFLRGVEAGKASTQDHYLVFLRHHWLPVPRRPAIFCDTRLLTVLSNYLISRND